MPAQSDVGDDVHWGESKQPVEAAGRHPDPPPVLGTAPVMVPDFAEPHVQSFLSTPDEAPTMPFERQASPPTSMALPTATGPLSIDVRDENDGVTFIGRHFYDAPLLRAIGGAFVVFSLVPALICLIGALLGDVYYMEGRTNVGFREDFAGLSYFLLGVFSPVLVHRMMRGIPLTIESLNSVIVLDDEDEQSTLSRERLNSLINMYSYLYCTATGRSVDGFDQPADEDLHQFMNTLLWMKRTIYALTALYATMTVFSRFTGGSAAVVINEWHLWSASPVGFVARSISDVLLTAVMGPLVLYPIVLCVMLIYHSLKQVSNTNSLKFVRFAKDEAGGLGQYGTQSFFNTMALLPYAGVIVGIIAQERSLDGALNLGFMAAMVTYFGLLGFVFFFPLASAAGSMGKLKQTELTLLSKHYSDAYERFREELSSSEPDLKELGQQSETMVIAEQIFDSLRSQPSVPYSRALIARLIGTIGPLAGVIGSLVFSA
jgi:hypothetical protein